MAKNYQYVVKKQASDLDKACNYLKNALGDAPWLHELSVAATTIRNQCKGDDWSVNIRDLDIPMDAPKHLIPKSLTGKLKMFVSIKMEGNGKLWNDNEDCVKSLNFKVVIKEKNPQDPQKDFHMGFHIDKMDSSDDSDEMHPLYHVHFINESKIYGTEALSMDVPRLTHHPVDVFLGILLVFANYNLIGYKKLLKDGNFIGLCKVSAKHILEPYYRSLLKVSYQEGTLSEYDKALCPYLVP